MTNVEIALVVVLLLFIPTQTIVIHQMIRRIDELENGEDHDET